MAELEISKRFFLLEAHMKQGFFLTFYSCMFELLHNEVLFVTLLISEIFNSDM